MAQDPGTFDLSITDRISFSTAVPRSGDTGDFERWIASRVSFVDYVEAPATVPTWVSPADTSTIGTTPIFVFTTPSFTGNAHFNIELDTAATFDTGNLRVLKTHVSQTGWEYWDGDSWESFPSTGLPDTYAGNNCRYTVQTPLSATTWYRRVRMG